MSSQCQVGLAYAGKVGMCNCVWLSEVSITMKIFAWESGGGSKGSTKSHLPPSGAAHAISLNSKNVPPDPPPRMETEVRF